MAASSDDEEDCLLDKVYFYLTEKQYADGTTENCKRVIRKKASKYVIIDGELHLTKKRKGKGNILVRYIKDKEERHRIVRSCHTDVTSGHLGFKKTLARVTERFSWKGITKDVEEFVKRCDVCQRINRKFDIVTPEMYPVPVKSPWYHIGIDFIGPVAYKSPAGNCFILTIGDYFTKWVEAFATPDKSAVQVCSCLFKLFMRMGIPRLITSDQGKQFNNQLNGELMKKLNIKHLLTTAYHPQANGLDERYNQTLQNMLVKYIKDKKSSWEEFLDTCVFAYNTAQHESTRYTPFEFMFGRKPVLPIDVDMEKKDPAMLLNEYHGARELSLTETREVHQKLLEAAKANITKAQLKQKEHYDKRHCKPGSYSVGEKMLVKDFNRKKRKGGKLDYRWKGPYIITKSLGRGLYSLIAADDSNVNISRVNGAHLKHYMSPICTDDSRAATFNAMEGSYCPVPDGDDTAEGFRSINSSSSYSENAMQESGEAFISTHNASRVTQDNTAVNDEEKVSQLDVYSVQLDQHSVYGLSGHPNQPNDMSSPIKPGGFYPEFFSDDNQFSPITAQSPGCKCSKDLRSEISPPVIPETEQTAGSDKTIGPKESLAERKNFVASILDSPRGLSKCKRRLQLSPENLLEKQQQKSKKRRRKLLISFPDKNVSKEATATTTKAKGKDADHVCAKHKAANTLIKDSEGIKLTQNSVPTVQKRKPPADSTPTVTASTTKHEQLQKIWNKKPCHIVKARIGHFVIHQGSFHCLKGTNLLNDEIVNGYLRLLVSLRGDSYAVIAQTITAIINRSCAVKTSEKPSYLLSKETLSNKTFIVGLYNQGNNHWILIAINMKERIFYYIDPLGPSKLIRGAYTAIKKFFETRHGFIRRDHVDIDKFKLVQLQRRVQRDGYNCGVLCLKIAEQLLNFNEISENAILRADMRKAREDIGIALLANSVDLTDRCVMCGRSESSFMHPDYKGHWVQCDGCDAWVHTICSGVTNENAEDTLFKFFCLDCCNFGSQDFV